MTKSPIKIFNDDCMHIMPTIEDNSIDLILCDLPYGTTNCSWDSVISLEELWAEYKRLIKPNGAIVLTASQPFTSLLVMSNIKWFKHEWIWHKSKSGSAFTAKYRPMAKHESVLVFGKSKVTYNPQMVEGEPYSRTRKRPQINNHKLGLGAKGNSTTINTGHRYPDSVIYFQQKWRRQDQLHPTQKPVDLFRYLIKTYSNEGELVLDNCMGSGTTAIAAIAEDRKFIGIEQNQKYYQIAEKRINDSLSENCNGNSI